MEFSYPSEWIVPNVVDRLGGKEPEAVYAEYPRSPLTYEKGYQSVTYRDLSNAVDNLAVFLQSRLGVGNCEILPYIGPNDLRYPALILGALKAGYAVRFLLTCPHSNV